MSAQFGTWIGTPQAGATWAPRLDPALVDDPRFPALVAAAEAILRVATDPGPAEAA